MVALANDEEKIKHDEHGSGQLRGLNRQPVNGSHDRSSCGAHGREEGGFASHGLVDTPTRRLPQYSPSPSPLTSSHKTDNAQSYDTSSSDLDPSSIWEDKEEDDRIPVEKLDRTNDADPIWSVKRNVNPAVVSQSRDGDTTIEMGDSPEANVPESNGQRRIRKLSSAKMYELMASPKSLPLYTGASYEEGAKDTKSPLTPSLYEHTTLNGAQERHQNAYEAAETCRCGEGANEKQNSTLEYGEKGLRSISKVSESSYTPRSRLPSHSDITPGFRERRSTDFNRSNRSGFEAGGNLRSTPTPLPLDKSISILRGSGRDGSMPSPMPSSGWPALPLSLPTYLQWELSSGPASDRYIHRSVANDIPYESSAVKIERLLNFLLLPPQLEQVLWFGGLACLDAWLYSFTILPLRFIKALSILLHSWSVNAMREVRFIFGFIYSGAGRMWHRRRRRSSVASTDNTDTIQPQVALQKATPRKDGVVFPRGNKDDNKSDPTPSKSRRSGNTTYRRHRRTKSTPSTLRQDHKADLLKGFLIIISCTILMYFDPSRMYHGIRGQAAIKLYVIYNVLEVCLFITNPKLI